MTISNSLIAIFGRRRIHTIVSREMIKPSSPTPCHRKTYNFSSLDQIITSTFNPILTFYNNPGYDKTIELKNSLSETLTKYYPFAGRYAKKAPTYVDCNDEGVEFLEASVDTTLTKFLQNSKYEDLSQCFPHGRVFNSLNLQSHDSSSVVIPLAVQVNRFECGGIAVAVSLSHKIADGGSLYRFVSDWAKVERFCSKKQSTITEIPIDPHFITCEHTNLNFSGVDIDTPKDCVTTRFVFPNSKINELKRKAMAMCMESGQPITYVTRIEVLTWLLYKCCVAAAAKNNKSGPYKATVISVPVNIRGKMMEQLPENTVGNIISMLEVETKKESEMKPGFLIGELRKKKMELGGIKDIQTIHSHILNTFSEAYAEEQHNKMNDYYVCTSLCGYPTYDIDFGWGKPVKVTVAGNLGKKSFILMDGPNGSIEAFVNLGKQDMKIVQTDPDLLAYVC